MFKRIQYILFQPDREWSAIKAEHRPNESLIFTYVLPLTFLAGLVSFIRLGISPEGYGAAARFGLMELFMPVLSIIIASFVINALAERFNSVRSLNNAFKLVCYSYTPMLLAAIIANIADIVSWISIFGLYGIYLFWIGLPVMMETPEENRLPYMLVSAVVTIVVLALIGLFVGSIHGYF